VPLLFIKKSEVGVALLFFDKERERSGTLKKRERLTHWTHYYLIHLINCYQVNDCQKNNFVNKRRLAFLY
jgi:hypothetical protein